MGRPPLEFVAKSFSLAQPGGVLPDDRAIQQSDQAGVKVVRWLTCLATGGGGACRSGGGSAGLGRPLVFVGASAHCKPQRVRQPLPTFQDVESMPDIGANHSAADRGSEGPSVDFFRPKNFSFAFGVSACECRR